jgi:hypothetical protein
MKRQELGGKKREKDTCWYNACYLMVSIALAVDAVVTNAGIIA